MNRCVPSNMNAAQPQFCAHCVTATPRLKRVLFKASGRWVWLCDECRKPGHLIGELFKVNRAC